MITLKARDYTPEDFAMLRKSLMQTFAAFITECETQSQSCKTCKSKRACDDLYRLLCYVMEK